MTKPRNPKDGRLKANRDFQQFMIEAIYKPFVTGKFKGDPTVCGTCERTFSVVSASNMDELSDAELVSILRAAMLAQGVKPQSTADTILGHLSARVSRRRAQNRP